MGATERSLAVAGAGRAVDTTAMGGAGLASAVRLRLRRETSGIPDVFSTVVRVRRIHPLVLGLPFFP